MSIELASLAETLTLAPLPGQRASDGQTWIETQDEDGDATQRQPLFSARLQLSSSLPPPIVPIAWPASRRRPDLSISTADSCQATPDNPCASQVNNNTDNTNNTNNTTTS